MAAKAEQHQPGGSRTYFRQLKDSFSDTQYYREIIRECGYFAEYVK